uniref:Uncharacterized protein n=1 Tax=Glossina pallidipes TaxID=7398 RepID=A0A1A9ZUX8_GLOPL
MEGSCTCIYIRQMCYRLGLIEVQMQGHKIYQVTATIAGGLSCNSDSFKLNVSRTARIVHDIKFSLLTLILQLPGGNLLFSISMATTFTMRTHMGHSSMSVSDFTKATADRHCVSKRRRSG